jgi:hypothetical protein
VADEDGSTGEPAPERGSRDDPDPRRDEREPAPGALLDRLVEVRATLARERDRAPSLWHELAALPVDRRLAQVAGEPRFQTFGLCELLLEKALAGHSSHADDAGHLASLALAAAERLDAATHAAPVAADLKARAWAEIGEARRAAGDLRAAEEALGEAAGCLAHGTGDLLVDGRLLEFEAAVRADQGRPGEADALLRQATARYAQVNEPELEARVRARREELRRAASAVPGPGHPAFGVTS